MRYYLVMVLIILSSYGVANVVGLVDSEILKENTKRFKKIEQIKVNE